MSNDEPVRKTSEGNETPGLKSSIAKALFDSLSPSRSPSLRAGNIVDVLTATTAIVSPDKKKVFDLSLSEGDLTLTDEYKTPTTILRTTSSQDHLPSVCSTSQKSVIAEAALKENSIKCTKNPREPRRTSNPECSTKGPNSDQLAWIRACRKGDIQACKALLDADPDILHYVAPLHLDYSAVHIATLGRHYELMRLLKSRGANFNAQTKSGYTPLHLAAQNQNRDMVRTLISEFGVNTRILDLHGYRYEYYADWLDYPEYDDLSCRTICSGGNMAGSSRQPSIGSQESLASSKNSFSRHGSIRETVRGLLHIPTRTRISRSPSPNPIAV